VSAVLVVLWSHRDESAAGGGDRRPRAPRSTTAGHHPCCAPVSDHAIDLWRRGLAPLLVLTAARPPRHDERAEASRIYAVRQGVPDSAILLGPKAARRSNPCARWRR